MEYNDWSDIQRGDAIVWAHTDGKNHVGIAFPHEYKGEYRITVLPKGGVANSRCPIICTGEHMNWFEHKIPLKNIEPCSMALFDAAESDYENFRREGNDTETKPLHRIPLGEAHWHYPDQFGFSDNERERWERELRYKAYDAFLTPYHCMSGEAWEFLSNWWDSLDEDELRTRGLDEWPIDRPMQNRRLRPGHRVAEFRELNIGDIVSWEENGEVRETYISHVTMWTLRGTATPNEPIGYPNQLTFVAHDAGL